MPDVLLFVYGSLKRGYANHHYMHSATFIKNVATAPRYRLFVLGRYPGLVQAEEGQAVSGELWLVPGEAIPALDEFEGSHEYYAREPVLLEDGTTAEAYFYQRAIPADATSRTCWPS